METKNQIVDIKKINFGKKEKEESIGKKESIISGSSKNRVEAFM
jgi:hypothetical protein